MLTLVRTVRSIIDDSYLRGAFIGSYGAGRRSSIDYGRKKARSPGERAAGSKPGYRALRVIDVRIVGQGDRLGGRVVGRERVPVEVRAVRHVDVRERRQDAVRARRAGRLVRCRDEVVEQAVGRREVRGR